jgi:hypothetical protein
VKYQIYPLAIKHWPEFNSSRQSGQLISAVISWPQPWSADLLAPPKNDNSSTTFPTAVRWSTRILMVVNGSITVPMRATDQLQSQLRSLNPLHSRWQATDLLNSFSIIWSTYIRHAFYTVVSLSTYALYLKQRSANQLLSLRWIYFVPYGGQLMFLNPIGCQLMIYHISYWCSVDLHSVSSSADLHYLIVEKCTCTYVPNPKQLVNSE